MIPNLGTLELHAAGKVAAGGALTDAVNVTGVVHNGNGDDTVTMASAIDEAHRFIMLSGTDTDGVLEHVIANDTDTTFDVGADTNGTAATPANHAFEFAVFRTVKIS